MADETCWLDLFSGRTHPHIAEAILRYLDFSSLAAVKRVDKSAFGGLVKYQRKLIAAHNAVQSRLEDLRGMETYQTFDLPPKDTVLDVHVQGSTLSVDLNSGVSGRVGLSTFLFDLETGAQLNEVLLHDTEWTVECDGEVLAKWQQFHVASDISAGFVELRTGRVIHFRVPPTVDFRHEELKSERRNVRNSRARVAKNEK